LAYKAKAVAFAQAHPKYSLKTLKSMGFAKLTRKDVLSGGTRHDKLTVINSETFERFKDARNNKEQI